MQNFDLLKELKELSASPTLQFLITEQKKNQAKSYTPNVSTIRNLRTPELKLRHNIVGIIQSISLFHYRPDKKFHLLQLLDYQFPFSKKDREEMTEETKYIVLENGLKGILTAFRRERKFFLSEDVMLEDDFEDQKLRYLMRKGKEPILFTEDDYEYLEQCLLHVLRIGASHFFYRVDNSRRREIDEKFSYELTMMFWLECIKRFSAISTYALSHLQWFLLQKVNSNQITQTEKEEFKEYTVCPITSGLMPNAATEDRHVDYLINGEIGKLYLAFKGHEKLKEFLPAESYDTFLLSIRGLLRFIETELQKGRKIRTLISGNNAQKSASLAQIQEIIENLPNLYQ